MMAKRWDVPNGLSPPLGVLPPGVVVPESSESPEPLFHVLVALPFEKAMDAQAL